MILNSALGDGGKPAGPPRLGEAGVKDLAAGHATAEAAMDAINAAMFVA